MALLPGTTSIGRYFHIDAAPFKFGIIMCVDDAWRWFCLTLYALSYLILVVLRSYACTRTAQVARFNPHATRPRPHPVRSSSLLCTPPSPSTIPTTTCRHRRPCAPDAALPDKRRRCLSGSTCTASDSASRMVYVRISTQISMSEAQTP